METLATAEFVFMYMGGTLLALFLAGTFLYLLVKLLDA